MVSVIIFSENYIIKKFTGDQKGNIYVKKLPCISSGSWRNHAMAQLRWSIVIFCQIG
jgi:hypothetical protein